MNVWIVYGSSFGQAEAVAERVGRRLREDGHRVTVSKGDGIPPGLTVEAFDVVLVAASVIMGRHQRYIRDFVRGNVSALAARMTGFISVSSASADTPEWRGAARGYVEGFLSKTGWNPRWTAMFSGALRYTRYNPLVRWVMKCISLKTGGPTDTSRDYDFTDWKAVDRFAEDVASELREEARISVGAVAD